VCLILLQAGGGGLCGSGGIGVDFLILGGGGLNLDHSTSGGV